MNLSTLLAGLTTSTKAAIGIGVATASVGAAGVAGVLPNPISTSTDAPTTTVVVPASDLSDASDPGTITVTAPQSDSTDSSSSDSSDLPQSPVARPDDPSSFGRSVASDARDGGVDGRSVASDARDQGQTGLDVAGSTPGGDHVPASIPAGPPDRSGEGAPTSTPAPPVTEPDAASDHPTGRP